MSQDPITEQNKIKIIGPDICFYWHAIAMKCLFDVMNMSLHFKHSFKISRGQMLYNRHNTPLKNISVAN